MTSGVFAERLRITYSHIVGALSPTSTWVSVCGGKPPHPVYRLKPGDTTRESPDQVMTGRGFLLQHPRPSAAHFGRTCRWSVPRLDTKQGQTSLTPTPASQRQKSTS